MVDLDWEGKNKNKEKIFNQTSNIDGTLNISEIIQPKIAHTFRQEKFLNESLVEDFNLVRFIVKYVRNLFYSKTEDYIFNSILPMEKQEELKWYTF